jgi:two-component system NarL family sensor kinase
VIHRLERAPNTEAERAALRTVAAHLRDVATELHPPVLDDLGLIAAIEALRPSDSSVDINISVAGSGYQRAQRPPPEVEIATYRIVQEAIANAIAHSGCRCIRVTGTVGRDEVVIDVADDGRGVSGRDIEAAMRAGHIGVASMRRRADAIDARMTHRSVAGTGTTVSLRWQA